MIEVDCAAHGIIGRGQGCPAIRSGFRGVRRALSGQTGLRTRGGQVTRTDREDERRHQHSQQEAHSVFALVHGAYLAVFLSLSCRGEHAPIRYVCLKPLLYYNSAKCPPFLPASHGRFIKNRVHDHPVESTREIYELSKRLLWELWKDHRTLRLMSIPFPT